MDPKPVVFRVPQIADIVEGSYKNICGQTPKEELIYTAYPTICEWTETVLIKACQVSDRLILGWEATWGQAKQPRGSQSKC